MRTRTCVARMATLIVLLVAATGLLTACGHEGTLVGATVGAAVGGAVGSTYDDPYYYDPYYYAASPGAYANGW